MKNKSKQELIIDPIAAGIAGAIVGAGVAVVAVAAMKDEETREKIKELLFLANGKAQEYMKNMKAKKHVEKVSVYKKRVPKLVSGIKQLEEK